MLSNRVDRTKPSGRVSSVSATAVVATGLESSSVIGDHVEVHGSGGTKKRGEVVEVSWNETKLLLFDESDGCSPGDRVVNTGDLKIFPCENWKGRVINAFGEPIDGKSLAAGCNGLKTNGRALSPFDRCGLGPRIHTGISLFDTVLPVARGQRLGFFAAAGVGKSSLIKRFISGIDADIIVFALVGERGREVAETYAKLSKVPNMAKVIMIVATSDEPACTRRQCMYTAVTVCEYFRNEGKHVALFADSVTRFAEAHREVASASGEAPALRGFPASLVHRLSSLCERMGTGPENGGAITSFLSVLVSGNDLDEPVADVLRGILDGHIILDRQIAERGQFPAVDVLRSVSRCLPDVATKHENAVIDATREMLQKYEDNLPLSKAGLYSKGSDRQTDLAIDRMKFLEVFFSSESSGNFDNSFAELEKIVV